MGVRRPRRACGAVALAKELAWGFFILLAFMKPPIAPFIFLAFNITSITSYRFAARTFLACMLKQTFR